MRPKIALAIVINFRPGNLTRYARNRFFLDKTESFSGFLCDKMKLQEKNIFSSLFL